jgi:Large polyvalent protein-associated domain 7
MPENDGASRESKDEKANRRRRARRYDATNTLRPSPAVVSWIFRAVSRLAAERQQPHDEAVQRRTARADSPASADKSAAPARRDSVPEEVHARFVRVGRDFHFPSGARAFRDHGHKVVTHIENAAVIRALVDIAVERGWSDITVSGTAKFRREAWRAATISGLVVRGYRPSEFDKQKLVRDLAAARNPSERPAPLVDFPQLANREFSAPMPHVRASTSTRAAEPASAARQPDGSKEGGSNRRERRYSGTLLEHGPAPYDFHPQGEPSYFLRIQTSRGPTVLWGKDLERAVNEAKVASGEEVHVRQAGRETVTVRRKERDQAGRVVEEHDVKAHRNQWEVSRDQHTDEQSVPRTQTRTAGASAGRAPDESALRALKGAQLFADERISDPAQRSAFVNAVREELAAAFYRGDPPPATHLRRAQRGAAIPARTLS